VLGIFQIIGGKGRVLPTNRRIRTEFVIPPGGENGASKGDLVEAQAVGGRSFGLPEARVVEVIGSATGPRPNFHRMRWPMPKAQNRFRRPVEPICAEYHWSRSTVPTPAISTMPSGQKPMPTRPIAADGT
jgi:hypothetical protein